jgi:hypothetical protein
MVVIDLFAELQLQIYATERYYGESCTRVQKVYHGSRDKSRDPLTGGVSLTVEI